MRTTHSIQSVSPSFAAGRPGARRVWLASLGALVAGGMLVALADAGAVLAGNGPCENTAGVLYRSALIGANSDYLVALAKANSYENRVDRLEAILQAREEWDETIELAEEQLEAREQLCELLHEGRYDPDIDPKDFLTPEEIAENPNPYWPMIPGTKYIYEGLTDEGLEVIEVTITDETREILGIDCVVVKDTVFIDGEIKEDTNDWHTQDIHGNVWYFGELTFEYEDGEIVGLEGSWEAGLDGAKPGIIAFGKSEVGVTYRQELLLTEAEDVGQILALNERVEVPYGTFDNCLKTADFTPIAPGVLENKFYAPGFGFVLEIKPDTGERVELVSIETR